MDDLSVGAFIGKLWDLIAGFFSPLYVFGWSIGDWTLFMPLFFYFIYWAYTRIRHVPNKSKIGGWVLVIGILVGGVFEHYQEQLEDCLPDGPKSCISRDG